MNQVRWDRVAAVLALLALPMILRYLRQNVSIPEFSEVPVLGAACSDPELKGLVLLGIILVAIVMLLRVLRGSHRG